MVEITKEGRVLKVPYPCYISDFQRQGWEIIKDYRKTEIKEQPKVEVKEEPKEEIKEEAKEVIIEQKKEEKPITKLKNRRA